MNASPARLALTLTVLAALAGGPAGAVELQQETRAVAGFHRIDINGEARVTLVQGATESVTIEAAALAQIHTGVHGGTLSVDVESQHSVWRWFSGGGGGPTPHVTIHLRDIDRIEGAGSVTLEAGHLSTSELRLDFAGACTLSVADLQATSLDLDGSGAMKVAIGGKVVRQKIDLSGAGSYQAADLVSSDAVVSVSGAGKAVVNASNSLVVDISGAGKVEYLGEPKLKQSISGFGKVTRRD